MYFSDKHSKMWQWNATTLIRELYGILSDQQKNDNITVVCLVSDHHQDQILNSVFASFQTWFLNNRCYRCPYGSGHSERVNCIHMGNSNQEISTLENFQGLKTQQWYSYMYMSQKYIHVCTESYTKTASIKKDIKC